MFGLTMREKVHELLERAYMQEIEAYKDEVLNGLLGLSENELSEQAVDSIVIHALWNYIERVLDIVYGVVRGAPGGVGARFNLALMSPEISGAPSYSDLPHPQGGSAYCFTYYAFTGKPGKPKDAIYSNQRVRYYTNKALMEIAEEHPEIP